jgi:hypothetical protein
MFRDAVAMKIEAVHMHEGDVVLDQSTLDVSLMSLLNELTTFVSDHARGDGGGVQFAKGLRVCMGDHNGTVAQRTDASFKLSDQDLCAAYGLRP